VAGEQEQEQVLIAFVSPNYLEHCYATFIATKSTSGLRKDEEFRVGEICFFVEKQCLAADGSI
jgi:hypothetical protein